MRSPRRSRNLLGSTQLSLGGSQAPSDFRYAVAAQRIAQQLGTAELKETDELILGTEEIVHRLDEDAARLIKGSDQHAILLADGGEQLRKLWDACERQEERGKYLQESRTIGIGPDENTPPYRSAIYLARLLLPLQHPPTAKGEQALADLRFSRPIPSPMGSPRESVPYNPTAYPKILLGWLNDCHSLYDASLSATLTKKPNPTAHSEYWDVLVMLVTRGRFADAIRLLRQSNFQHAQSARTDGLSDNGYRGVQLQNTQSVVEQTIEVLSNSPIVKEDNWNVSGQQWTFYRQVVRKALKDLERFAEGSDQDVHEDSEQFEASQFGLERPSKSMSMTSRRSESKVPWSVFQNLKIIYGILLGSESEIISSSQDWVEATIALTAWWTGEDDGEFEASTMSASKRPLLTSRNRRPRLVDQDSRLAYGRRLPLAFKEVLAGSNEVGLPFPNIQEPLEVGLASIFEGDFAGVLDIVKAFSVPVADSLVEIGSIGGWLDTPKHDEMPEGFDESDLMVLSSFAPPKKTSQRSEVMTSYADALFERGILVESGKSEVNGWELAIDVVARLAPGKEQASRKRIGEYLDRLSQDSDSQIDKILQICQQYRMIKEAQSIVNVSLLRFRSVRGIDQNSGTPTAYSNAPRSTDPLLYTTLERTVRRRLRTSSIS